MRRPLIALSALTLGVLAGCGGDDDPDASDATAAASATATAAVGSGAADDDGDDDTAEGDDGDDDFCAALSNYQAITNSEVLTASEPPSAEAMEETFEELDDGLDDLEDLAPDDISADVGIVAAGTRQFMDALEEADYDFEAVITDPAFAELTAEFESEPYVSATANLQRYASETCGLNGAPDVTAAGSPESPVTVGPGTTTDG